MEGSPDILWCVHCKDLISPTVQRISRILDSSCINHCLINCVLLTRSCSVCGKVLYQSVITTEPDLVKSRRTKKRRASSLIVKSISSDHSQSSKRTLNKGFMSKSSAEAAHKILKKEHGKFGGAADCKPHVGNQENVNDCSYDGDDEDDHN